MRAMAGALLYLRMTTLAGAVKARLRRLKQPKYLLGAVVGAAWIWFTFLRRLNPSRVVRPGVESTPAIPADLSPLLLEFFAFLMIVVLMLNWLVPRRASLRFTEAEIAFLFPAPVNRRMLIHYRLLGTQLGLALTSLVFSVLFGRGQAAGGNLWFHAVGWWVVLATLNLHVTGTSFVYSKILNRSLTSRVGQVAALSAVYGIIAILVVWIALAVQIPPVVDLADGEALKALAASLPRAGPLPWLLYVPKLLVAPFFAADLHEFVLALGPALAVFAAHYFWVVRTEVSFEEASILKAEKRAHQLRKVREGDWRGGVRERKRQKEPFKLADAGRPEVAFLWKNLLSTGGIFRPQFAFAAAGIVLVGSQFLLDPQHSAARYVAQTVCGVVFAMALLFGPQMARQDLRSDLRNADLLKTYPLRGWQILLGELLTPLAILTTIAWLCVLASWRLLPADALPWLTPALRTAAAVGIAVLAPPFIALQLLVPNAAAVIFPAWSLTSGNPAERGIEVMGQRIIFMAGQMLIMAFALVPAAIVAGLMYLIAAWLAGALVAGALGVAAACAVLCTEAWVGLRLLGERFERFDLSVELRP